MPERERPDQEPAATPAAPPAAPKSRQSFARLRRELSDEELASPAVQRLLIDDIERLERLCTELNDYREKFYAADQKSAILQERAKKSLSGEVIFGVSLTVGAASLGFAPALWQQQPAGWIAIVFGSVLIIGGIVSRVVQR